jgi:putative ABC transport system permease protein
MSDLLQDVRLALRRLAHAPGFTLVALVSLALAIGANTALFSVVHAVLLKALPFARPERLYWVWSRHTSTDRYPFSLPEFCDYRDRNRTLESFAGFANWSGNLAGEGPTERIPGLRVSDNFFELLGVAPALGRTLVPGDDQPGREAVVVLSHGLWQRRFGGDRGVVGRPITLNGAPFTVVGVLEPGFLFPLADIELAIPLAPDQDPWRHNRESTSFIRVLGRARAGTGGEQIAADLEAIHHRLQEEHPGSYARKKGVLVMPYREALTGGFSRVLWMLMAAVGLLLLIACANLASLMMARATARRQEMAIRLALGARPASLMRDLLLESVFLALAGAALGALLARAGVPALVALSPTAMPRSQEIQISLPVLLFTMAAGVLAGLAFGLAPAWRATRGDPIRDLRSEGRGEAGGADASRTRGLIVAAQVAMMVVLLTVAALLFKSFDAVMRIEPGFDPRLLTVRMSLPRADYAETRKLGLFYEALEARIRRLPGVVEVAAVNHLPLNGAIASADYKVEDRPPASDDQLPTALYRMVTPRYFQAMGIPLIAGRSFGDGDREGLPAVAVVSQALARLSFPDRDPVGRHLLVKDNPDGFRSLEIVGVAGDVRHGSLEGPPEPHLYVPYHQTNPSLLVWLAQTQFLVVRAGGDPLSLGASVRQQIQAVDPNVASAGGRLTDDYVAAAAAARRFSVLLLGLFAAIALTMAVVGIYGVIAYGVARRTRETGLRLALGASRTDILVLVLGEGLKRTLLGSAAGLIVAFVVARSLGNLLFGVGVADLPTYAGVVALLVTVTLFACVLPAWRAARLEPVRALRHQ